MDEFTKWAKSAPVGSTREAHVKLIARAGDVVRLRVCDLAADSAPNPQAVPTGYFNIDVPPEPIPAYVIAAFGGFKSDEADRRIVEDYVWGTLIAKDFTRDMRGMSIELNNNLQHRDGTYRVKISVTRHGRPKRAFEYVSCMRTGKKQIKQVSLP